MRSKRILLLLISLALIVSGIAFLLVPWTQITSYLAPFLVQQDLSEAIAAIRPAASARLIPMFTEAGIAYPPKEATLVALKEEKRLEIYGRGEAGWKRVTFFPIKAASGTTGPKLKQGDLQVPEGVYKLVGFNPNSHFHLSLKVGYPNAFDKEMAKADGRERLGGDIFIHGGAASIGCIAIGDPAIEELFLLANDVGLANITVLIAPRDLRSLPVPETTPHHPSWLPRLYRNLSEALRDYP